MAEKTNSDWVINATLDCLTKAIENHDLSAVTIEVSVRVVPRTPDGAWEVSYVPLGVWRSGAPG